MERRVESGLWKPIWTALCAYRTCRIVSPLIYFPFRAKHLDANRPNPLPPLFGLPLSIKDLFDYPGVDSTIGLASWIGNKSGNKSVVVKVIEEQGGWVDDERDQRSVEVPRVNGVFSTKGRSREPRS